MRLLTKSHFLLAEDCPAKLFYKLNNYGSDEEENEYLEYLRNGGFIVGKLAQLMHPGGMLIDAGLDPETAAAETAKALEAESVLLYEAQVLHGGMAAISDIVIKRGKTLEVLEVKSKGFDGDLFDIISKKSGRPKSEFLDVCMDLTFQTMLWKLSYPDFTVVPSLMLVNKQARATIDGLAMLFSIEEHGGRVAVRFTGPAESVAAEKLLSRISLTDGVNLLMQEVSERAARYLESMTANTKLSGQLDSKCKDCEFKAGNGRGFKECWGDLAEVKPHVLDLYRIGNIKVGKEPLIEILVRDKKASFDDITDSALSGRYAPRQRIQIESTKTGKEWFGARLKEALEQLQFPLYFIDFETSMMAVPYHKGMRPYENVAFQWSCHTLRAANEPPEHADWINTAEIFPNFEFARSLMDQVGGSGTPLMWATHENTILTHIRRQMVDYSHKDGELRDWLDSIIATDDSDGRLTDMADLTRKFYFHPDMKGSASLKYVLPAIWRNNPYLWEMPWLKRWVKLEDGRAVDPYETLPDLEIAGVSQVIRRGTGAMTAYQDMVYGASRGDALRKEKWQKLLRQYCELDTMAMVIVWRHWIKQGSNL